jgi:tRNA(His) 5'-end guanylyltransferase
MSSLGDRMKQYETVSKTRLIHRMPVIIRLDGCHFHTFTKGFEKPFDAVLMTSMIKTMKFLCQNIQGCVFGYTQSDEISLILVDYKKLNSSAWYDNEVQKMCSVAASLCTLKFNEVFKEEVELFSSFKNHISQYAEYMHETFLAAYNKALKTGAVFDCRAFNVPKEDVCNYVIWRQQDATRNSIQSLAQSVFSHKELQGLSCDKLQDKLFKERNINWNDLEVYKKRGTACYNRGEEYSDWAVDFSMPILTQDRDYINKHVFVGE